MRWEAMGTVGVLRVATIRPYEYVNSSAGSR
jgi:hypothetical protein